MRRKPCKSGTFARTKYTPYARHSPDSITRERPVRVEGQIELTAESLWAEVAGRLKEALNTTTYKTWFAEVGGAELSDEAFTISVPNDFTREWIEGHFLGLISAAVRDSTGQERRIALSVSHREPELPERAPGFAWIVARRGSLHLGEQREQRLGRPIFVGEELKEAGRPGARCR